VETLPSTAASKRTRVARTKPATARVDAAPAPKKPVVRKKKAAATTVAADVNGMIATAAYYMAERRNFTPGCELEDWLEAEKQVKALFK
jgi:hypothetical protein